METLPYSIYFNKRPMKIAFLLDPKGDQEWFDKIYEYNREKWGGRFNPIIFSNGKTIKDDWWIFLKGYDPDIIKSTIPLEDKLKKKIHIFLSPLTVETVDFKSKGKYISLSNDPISISPNNKNLSFISPDPFGDGNNLVIFNLGKYTPRPIKQFLARNFGVLEDNQMMSSYLKRAIEGCKTKVYKISSYKSLNKALLDLGEFRSKIVFLSQICAIPNSFKDAEHDYNNEKFAIIIGDTAKELSYLWNRTLMVQNWLRKDITQIWLSKDLAKNQIIKPGLSKFINRFVTLTGNSSHQAARFITFSLRKSEVQKIADSFDKSVFWKPRTVNRFNECQFSKFSEYSSVYSLERSPNFYRANSNEEHLILAEPDVKEEVMGGQSWFVDIHIQFRPERFKHMIGSNYWWQFPRRNNILSDLRIFNKPARINEEGSFSVLMKRSSDYHPDENILVINLPDDRSVFSSLICGESYDYFKGNKGDRFESRPFYTIQHSDKGKYLSGIIRLFGSLFNAHYWFEERYWRRIFELMSNQNNNKDILKKDKIVSTLKKNIIRGRDLSKSSNIKWLAERIFTWSKDYAKKENDLSFNSFVKEAEKETNEYNKKAPGNHIEFDEKGLKNTMSDLLDRKVLLLGVRPRCPRCGYRTWYHIDEMRQKIICKGCGYRFILRTEEKWYYRLNSLIRATTSFHGTTAVLLVLGQIMNDARSSFLFLSSADLFKRSKDKKTKHWGEIDLVCIKDGKFIIGEIKQSIGLFNENDFKKIGKLAKVIKPDIVIFSSLTKNKKPNKLVASNIIKLKKELSSLKIDVQWYPIRYWAFEASPVR